MYQTLHDDAGCSISEVGSLIRHSEVQVDLPGFPTDCGRLL